jgi:hypothetical protein
VPNVTCPACGKRLASDLRAMDGAPVAPKHMRPGTYEWCDGRPKGAPKAPRERPKP